MDTKRSTMPAVFTIQLFNCLFFPAFSAQILKLYTFNPTFLPCDKEREPLSLGQKLS